MSIEENKAIARQIAEPQNIARLPEILSPDFVWHIAGLPHPLNRESYIQGVEMGQQAFSDLKPTIEDLIAEGDKVVLRLTLRGRHTGEFAGIAPTGKQVEFTTVAILRIINNKIVEEWRTSDQWTLYQQLGASPPRS